MLFKHFLHRLPFGNHLFKPSIEHLDAGALFKSFALGLGKAIRQFAQAHGYNILRSTINYSL
jgi:hypothetical protein